MVELVGISPLRDNPESEQMTWIEGLENFNDTKTRDLHSLSQEDMEALVFSKKEELEHLGYGTFTAEQQEIEVADLKRMSLSDFQNYATQLDYSLKYVAEDIMLKSITSAENFMGKNPSGAKLDDKDSEYFNQKSTEDLKKHVFEQRKCLDKSEFLAFSELDQRKEEVALDKMSVEEIKNYIAHLKKMSKASGLKYRIETILWAESYLRGECPKMSSSRQKLLEEELIKSLECQEVA